MTTFQNTPRPTHSIWDCEWGGIDEAEQIAPGIWRVSTPAHGGLILSPERMAAMPPALKINVDSCFFEEDCEWALVAVAFPLDFAEDIKHAVAAICTGVRYALDPECHPYIAAAGNHGNGTWAAAFRYIMATGLSARTTGVH